MPYTLCSMYRREVEKCLPEKSGHLRNRARLWTGLQEGWEVQWLAMNLAARVIGSILKHDKKVNSYKIALVRAVNDVVLSYPDLVDANLEVAVPLRRLAQQWLAYYWPFMDPGSPVLQGPRAKRRGGLGNDVAFRPALTRLRIA